MTVQIKYHDGLCKALLAVYVRFCIGGVRVSKEIRRLLSFLCTLFFFLGGVVVDPHFLKVRSLLRMVPPDQHPADRLQGCAPAHLKRLP